MPNVGKYMPYMEHLGKGDFSYHPPKTNGRRAPKWWFGRDKFPLKYRLFVPFWYLCEISRVYHQRHVMKGLHWIAFLQNKHLGEPILDLQVLMMIIDRFLQTFNPRLALLSLNYLEFSCFQKTKQKEHANIKYLTTNQVTDLSTTKKHGEIYHTNPSQHVLVGGFSPTRFKFNMRVRQIGSFPQGSRWLSTNLAKL